MSEPRVLRNFRIARTSANQSGYALLDNRAIAMVEGHIAWVGDGSSLPKDFAQFPTTDLSGRLVTPSFIDCHAHIVHGGICAREFELRLKSENYEAIAEVGGGIISTVYATRGASEDMLLEEVLPRVYTLIAEWMSTL